MPNNISDMAPLLKAIKDCVNRLKKKLTREKSREMK